MDGEAVADRLTNTCEAEQREQREAMERSLTRDEERIEVLDKMVMRLYEDIVQDQTWNRVTINRAEKKATRYYMDEFHLLLKEEQTAAYSVEIWKRFRKWGGIPTAITQNVKDLLASREVENIFENSDFVLMLNQAQGDRTILAKQLMALTENGEAAKKPEICNCTEKCEVGKVNTSCPVCVTSMTGCTGKEPTPTPTEQPEELKEKGGNPGVVLALGRAALTGRGGTPARLC